MKLDRSHAVLVPVAMRSTAYKSEKTVRAIVVTRTRAKTRKYGSESLRAMEGVIERPHEIADSKLV